MNFTTAEVVCITAMINYKVISFSAVQIYVFSYIHLHSSPFRGGISRTHNVTSSRCGIAEVTAGSNPVQA